MLNYSYLGMTATEIYRQLFLHLHQQLEQDEVFKKMIHEMISYREKKLATLPMQMEEKLLVMKESNVIAIIQFMQKMLSQKVILDFDLKLLNE